MSKFIHLKFRSPNTEPDTMTFIACKACHNKTYTLVEDRIGDFPLMRCAACGQHMGRMGWAHDDDPINDRPADRPAGILDARLQP